MKCNADWCSETKELINYRDTGLYFCKKHGLQMYRHGRTFRTRYDKNDFIFHDGYAEIQIYDYKGDYKCSTAIDLVSVGLCKKHKWCTTADGYVMTCKNKKHIYLHRMLTCAKNDEVAVHK